MTRVVPFPAGDDQHDGQCRDERRGPRAEPESPGRLVDEAELRALLSIRALPGIGDVRLTALLRESGSAVVAWQRIAAERADAAARVGAPGVAGRIERALGSLMQADDLCAIPAYHPAYPAPLLDLHDPPPLLFIRGDRSLFERERIAVVGTRACTAYGAEVTRAVAAALAGSGIVVVSGLAHGIDRHAHEAALDAGGTTIAVIGCGIDVVYPHRNRRLHEDIARRGLLVSEFLPGEPALPHHFPRRNRIIAALSAAVVVVEAPERSGALITAEHALDLGREVIAVPGPIGRRTSAGTNALIRDGAGILLSADDFLADLPRREGRATEGGRQRAGDPGRERRATGRGPQRAGDTGWKRGEPGDARLGVEGGRPRGEADGLEAVLGNEPRHVDELAAAVGLAVPRTLALLLELELAGRARAYAGGRYGRATGPRR